MTFEIYILGILVTLWLLSLEYIYEKHHYQIIFSSVIISKFVVLSAFSWVSAIILLVCYYKNIWWAMKYINRNGYDD